MTLAIVGMDHILHGTHELLLAVPQLIRPILLTFTLFFTVCIFMCGVAYMLIAMRSSLSMMVNDSDGLCSRWMKKFVASDEFIGIGVLGYVLIVAFVVGRALDLVLGICW
ncbi:ff3a7622-aec5-4e73-beb9-2cd87f7afa6c [Sclerotinia trifoliorum]|uniref:Ff3a7622-aec5-4e73-beb9-2cd87f7afa6c n=1 Tax=Sclerotinia trifoliorum TaxID=28548 RepID=A0A8H2ZUX7_9HELO|nr:ff3a7622-aec5-4e73-beb9-2cd87f7afa6c [Sclerotinia trifoliorum]